MPFLINGSAASITPLKQTWIDFALGQDTRGRTILYDKKDVLLSFDSCSPTLYKQWEDAVESASGGSINTLTMLERDSVTFRAFSGVYIEFEKRPSFESLVATGPWSIRLREVAS